MGGGIGTPFPLRTYVVYWAVLTPLGGSEAWWIVHAHVRVPLAALVQSICFLVTGGNKAW